MNYFERFGIYANLIIKTLQTFKGTAPIYLLRPKLQYQVDQIAVRRHLELEIFARLPKEISWVKVALQRSGYMTQGVRGVWTLSAKGLMTEELSPSDVVHVYRARGRKGGDPNIIPLMREESQLGLLDVAANYFWTASPSAKPKVPIALITNLLCSQDEDQRLAGLYILDRDGQMPIHSSILHNPECYPTLSRALVAKALCEQEMSGRRWSAQQLNNYLAAQTDLPAELMQHVTRKIEGFIDSTQRESPGLQKDEEDRKIALIVHGTFAATENWWRPNVGNFWMHIKGHWAHLYDKDDYFSWSGSNRHSARVAAASKLIDWCATRKVSSLDIIAHSHGGNVCLGAARAGLKINRLVLLGTPIRTEYMLDLRNIESISNVFSLNDKIQTPIGSFPNTRFDGRTLGDSRKVSNWRCEHNGKGSEPGHGELHEPSAWIQSGLLSLLR